MKPLLPPRRIYLACADCGAPAPQGPVHNFCDFIYGDSCPSCGCRIRAWRQPLSYWPRLAFYHLRRFLRRWAHSWERANHDSPGQIVIAPDGLPIFYIGLSPEDLKAMNALPGLERHPSPNPSTEN